MLDNTDLIERVTRLEQNDKSAQHRLNELEEEVKENRELIIAVKEITAEMKHLREEQTDMNNRLKLIEEKPLKDYEETKSQVKKQVISFFLGIGLTAIAFTLGLSKFL